MRRSSFGAEFLTQRPALLLAIAAFAAVLLNCYPVVFCGRSFVSPNNGAPDNGGNSLLYDTTPTLPGLADDRIADFHGADTGAIMWHDVPNAFVEARALFKHRALPLWNRYKNAGDPLLPQAISMFGDPLHFVVLAGGGAAWAWDLKFLLAKALFAFGCGLLVRDLTRHLGIALLFTGAAAYCGLFNFIPNHPGFFVFCYSPWILLSARQVHAASGRSKIRWALLWLIANSGCFNAGHVEAAVVCLGGLNVLALSEACLAAPNWRVRGQAAVTLAALTGLFAGLNAPVWVSFLAVLPQSFNLHTGVAIEQFSLAHLAGLFDDCFFHVVQDGPLARGPGGTLLTLFGLCFALAGWRSLRGNHFLVATLGTLVIWGGFIFGYIPPSVVQHLPLIRQIGHIRADFGYLAVLQTLLAAAYGCLVLLGAKESRSFWRRWTIAASGVIAIEAVFFWSTRAMEKPAGFYLYVAVATVCSLLTAPLFRRWQQASGAARLGLAAALGLALFLPQARFGLYTFGPDLWVLKPGIRARLDPPSAAVAYVQQAVATEPARVTGLAWDLYGGYVAVYGLEDIKGVSALMNRAYNELCTHYPGIERDGYLIELTDSAAARNLLSMLNVRYLLLNNDDPPPDGLPYHTVGKFDLTVFENESVWPRAFFVNSIRTYRNVSEFVSILQQDGEHPFAAISEDELERRPELRALLAAKPTTAHPVAKYNFSSNDTAFDIDAPDAGIVVLSEALEPQGCSVEVNGVPAALLPLNFALKGVYLAKAGHYHITFRYQPPYWRLSTFLFWISLILCGAGLLASVSKISVPGALHFWFWPRPRSFFEV